MTRYFMTIPEAANLAMHAGAIGTAGETYILDMGAPVAIVDLAQTMIRRSGKAIDIRFTGIRPGEKLVEELADADAVPTSHPKIRRLRVTDDVDSFVMVRAISPFIDEPRAIVNALRAFVPEYRPIEVTT